MSERFGERIKRIRMERGLGLRETARKVGISATFLSRVENGVERYPPREDVIRQLAEQIGEDFDLLMHLAGRVPQDVLDVIKNDPGMPAFLRAARDQELSGEQLLEMLEESKKKKKKKKRS